MAKKSPLPMVRKRRCYKAIAEYYDAECATTEWLSHDVPFLLERMPRKGVDVLELACGTARASIPLAQGGHRVVGVDYDPAMLKIARRKRDAVGVLDDELRLVQGDLLNLNLGQTFDWAVIVFNTLLGFVTLDEQDRLLDGVARHLRPGGHFWIDIFQPNLVLMAQHRSVEREPIVFYVPEFDRAVYRCTDIVRDPAAQLQRIAFRYTWFDEKGQTRHQRTQFDLTFLFPRELQLLLERHGFVIERLWGDYDGNPLGADSPRIIADCVKT